MLLSCEGVCVCVCVCMVHLSVLCTVVTARVLCPAGLALHKCNGVYHQSEFLVYAGHSQFTVNSRLLRHHHHHNVMPQLKIKKKSF